MMMNGSMCGESLDSNDAIGPSAACNYEVLEPAPVTYQQSQATQLDSGYSQEFAMAAAGAPIGIEEEPQPWIRLVSLSATVPPRELYENDIKATLSGDDSTEILNIHTLGRSKKCDIVFDSAKVSNNHCKLYCKRVYLPPGAVAPPTAFIPRDECNNNTAEANNCNWYLEAWIEDTSANGTFINRSTRLMKNVGRLLRSGDEISLINVALLDPSTAVAAAALGAAKVDTANSRAVATYYKKLREEVDRHSFNIILPNQGNCVATTAAAVGGAAGAVGATGVGAGAGNNGTAAAAAGRGHGGGNGKSGGGMQVTFAGVPMLEETGGCSSSSGNKHTADDSAATGRTAAPSSASTTTASSSSVTHRESTVVRMIHKHRTITDYYTITRMIGSGGCGIVYEGINKYTGVAFAIKKMDLRQLLIAAQNSNNGSGGGDMNTVINDLLREAEMLRLIRHSSIIRLEDVFSDESHLYLVMELVKGGDLFDRLQVKGTYTEAECKAVIRQLLEALQFLHIKNIAHRDLKPENILLVSPYNDTNIKLTDFGLAKQIGEGRDKKLKTFCGTPQYFAPEVYKRQHANNNSNNATNFSNSAVANRTASQMPEEFYTLAADMWSVGVMLFVLLSAEYPFPDVQNGGTIPVNLLRAKFAFNGPKWNDTRVSSQCKHFIKSLLQRNPDHRLTAEEALNHPWLAVPPASSSGSASSSAEAAAARPVEPDSSLLSQVLHGKNTNNTSSTTDANINTNTSADPIPVRPVAPALPAVSITAGLIQDMNSNMHITEQQQRLLSQGSDSANNVQRKPSNEENNVNGNPNANGDMTIGSAVLNDPESTSPVSKRVRRMQPQTTATAASITQNQRVTSRVNTRSRGAAAAVGTATATAEAVPGTPPATVLTAVEARATAAATAPTRSSGRRGAGSNSSTPSGVQGPAAGILTSPVPMTTRTASQRVGAQASSNKRKKRD